MFDILSEKACDFALNEASRSADFFVLVPAQSLEVSIKPYELFLGDHLLK